MDNENPHPGWEHINCGCCAGIKWGGDRPRECTDCDGMGFLWKHIKSGALAQYPGGPFLGSEPKDESKTT